MGKKGSLFYKGGEIRMERWVLVAETNCSVPSREKEFNYWYDTVHIPDVLETPGILRATRYENSDPPEGRGKFLALYEIETGEIERTSAALGEIITNKWEQGRMSELVVAVSATFYRQMGPTIEEK
jgi:hypothetical protein